MKTKVTRQQIFEKSSLSGRHVVVMRPGYISIRNTRTGVSVRFWDDGGQNRDDIPLDLALSMTVAQSKKALGL